MAPYVSHICADLTDYVSITQKNLLIMWFQEREEKINDFD